MTEIHQKIARIREELAAHAAFSAHEEQPNDGLLSGKPGLALFFYYHHKQTGNEADLSLIEDLIAGHLNQAETLVMNPYYCNGLAGFNWLLRFFAREKALELSDSMEEILGMLDVYVLEAYSTALNASNFDFLHGSCGLLQYLLTTPEAPSYAEEFVRRLDETKVRIDDNRIAWESNITFINGNTSVFNFGLAHGMSAILLMLARIVREKVVKDDQTARKLLEGCSHFMLSEKLDAACVSTFPNYFSADIEPLESRLAWCYGDLGVCIALWKAGEALNDEPIKEEAIAICLKTTLRRDPSQTGVLDTGICHGTAGIALMYRRMYDLTGVQAFREASGFWMEETLRRGNLENGSTGFSMWTKDGYMNEVNLLEGTAGIGMVLLSQVAEMPGDWEDILLLS